jgi:hypothetical protein
MKRIYIKLFVVIVLTASSIFAGGGVRNGTGAAPQLLIPVGVRGIAMGGSSLAGSAGLEALYWNPANLSIEGGTNVLFSHMTHIADIGVTYFGVSTNIEGFGSVGLTLKSLAIGTIDVTTVENPDGTGQSFKPSFMTLGLTYSRMLSDRISVGMTVNYVTETIDLVSASTLAFNIGVTYRNLANIEGFSLAMVLKNLGPQMKYDGSGLYIAATPTSLERGETLYKREAAAYDLPSTLEIGLSYQYNINSSNSLQLDGTYENANYYADEYKLGLEYSLNNMFFVRGGYALTPELDNADYNIYGITAGLGLKYDLGGGTVMKLDYAYKQTKFFDDTHVIGVQFGF